jgi:uncharacterized protein YndB with AHSA1/START domain
MILILKTMMQDTITEKSLTSDTSDRELIITRILNARRALVFDAWTDPVHIVKWWGPNGFTNTNLEMDVRPGGKWRFIMHGPDGTNYPNRIAYTQVIRPEILEYVHDADKDDDPNKFQVKVTFEEIGNKTKITMKMLVKSPEVLKEFKRFGAVEGGNQTLERLENYLNK